MDWRGNARVCVAHSCFRCLLCSCGCRCLWDQQTDKVAEATFQNVRIIVSDTQMSGKLTQPSRRSSSPSRSLLSAPRLQESLFCVAVAFGVYLY